ncbi:MAG: hypothetical protein PVG02_01860, partial [Anaerolineales bacterium]
MGLRFGWKRSGDVDLGFAGGVPTVGAGTAVADVCPLAALKGIVTILAQENIITFLTIEAVITTTTD